MEEVENIDSNDIATVIQWLQEADNIVVFTGAGITKDYGIPESVEIPAPVNTTTFSASCSH